MGVSSAGYHESEASLSPETRELHRAIVSLIEELEAIDWYQQRVNASEDPDLRRILEHNRDEEKEHAAMTLEWLRRHDPELSRYLRLYLFSDGPIVERGEQAGASNGSPPGNGSAASLPIGSLRGGR